ncbi:hypothetical protein KBD68_04535 [Candidatus Woesebacteria bacterium]|nr:hypothetical protein [Candidatus Woesebacteria bacterium]
MLKVIDRMITVCVFLIAILSLSLNAVNTNQPVGSFKIYTENGKRSLSQSIRFVTDDACLFDANIVDVVSDKTILIHGESLWLTDNQIRRLDSLVSKMMQKSLPPAFVWMVDTTIPPEIAVMYQTTVWDARTAINIFWWDGCHLTAESDKLSVSVIAIKHYPDIQTQLNLYLHERSHTMGSLHGAATDKGLTADDRAVTGPFDAYWWSFVGTDGYSGNCTRYVDQVYLTTCQEVHTILTNP